MKKNAEVAQQDQAISLNPLQASLEIIQDTRKEVNRIFLGTEFTPRIPELDSIFALMENKLVIAGAVKEQQPPPKFDPIIIPDEEKARLTGKIHNSSTSVLDETKSPYPLHQIQHQEQILNGGILHTLLSRHMRIYILNTLKKEMSVEAAENGWYQMFMQIVKAHFYFRYPERYRAVIDNDQAEKIKKDYPLQFQLLNEISQKLEKGGSVKRIAFSIDPSVVIN